MAYTQCMGGFCPIREGCQRYTADGVARLRAAERLCAAKTHEAYIPVVPLPVVEKPEEIAA